MGSGISRKSAGPSHRAGTRQRLRPSIKRTISSLLICGASQSSSREMEDYPAELLVNSAEHGHEKKCKFPRQNSDLSLGSGDDLTSIKSENAVPGGRCLTANENLAPEVVQSNVEPNHKGKWLSESRELVPCNHSITMSVGNETASTSNVDQQSPFCVPESETSSGNAINGLNGNINRDSCQIVEGLNNLSSIYPRVVGESSLADDVSVENNVSEQIHLSQSDFDSSSFVSDSPVDFDLLRDDTLREVIPSGLGFLVSEREQNRQDVSLLHVDVVNISSNILSNNSAELSSREARRNSRRLFWDAFSRRSSSRHTDSRTSVFWSADSDPLRSHDRWLVDSSGGSSSDGIGGDLRSHGSRTQGNNEQRWSSRSEIWERLRGSLDLIENSTTVCPRGLHAGGACSCQSSSSSEDSSARAGISRMVLLAEALFEVLDQIHQQPMSLSLSVVSLPAPESVVDSFPVKTHTHKENFECANDVSQCYICLAEYEDGDKIRVLPCHHEYHMSCVDKWLKEIHGVCPLCRGDVRDGFTEGSNSN